MIQKHKHTHTKHTPFIIIRFEILMEKKFFFLFKPIDFIFKISPATPINNTNWPEENWPHLCLLLLFCWISIIIFNFCSLHIESYRNIHDYSFWIRKLYFIIEMNNRSNKISAKLLTNSQSSGLILKTSYCYLLTKIYN